MSTKGRTYLDHNATSPLRPNVRKVLIEALDKVRGNPSSVHHEGRQARQILDDARDQIASLINCHPNRLYFTSGATECANWAIKGLASLASAGRPIVVSAVEHPCVSELAKKSSHTGLPMSLIPVDRDGLVDVDEYKRAILTSPKPTVAAVMMANHETGVIQPIKELAAIAAHADVPFFCDAVQAVSTLPIDVKEMSISLLSISAHKLGGPQGIGCLYVEPGLPLAPLLLGGLQEGGMRSGTQAVALAAAMGETVASAVADQEALAARLTKLKEKLEAAVLQVPGVHVVGQNAQRVATTTCLTITGIEGATLMAALDLEGISVSTGSACSLGTLDMSPVLQAMGYSAASARSETRVSMGYSTTEADINKFIKAFPDAVAKCRSLSVPGSE